MAFTGYAFVLFFFVIVLPARWLLPYLLASSKDGAEDGSTDAAARARRNESNARIVRGVLLVASGAFYLTWGWELAILLAVLTTFTYGAGVLLRTQQSPRKRKQVLAASIVLLLATLASFKYAAFFASFFPGVQVPKLPLPLGISFCVFEMISYLVDVYRGDHGAQSLPEFALYVSYFPHLIAGPIVRASELLPQLREDKPFDSARASEGMFIMLTGFVKKMVIADNLAIFADAVFKKPESFNTIELVAGVAAYTGQIYCDFSGYTDIARGGSTMLGFELPENFDYPYLSRSITEFWRRWHMTLSRWLRDYLYIPLGGNRGSELATYRNLFLTMALGGLWHGARITFVLWGAYHGVLLALHKLYSGETRSARWVRIRENIAYQALATVSTLVLVMIGWVFFRAVTFHDAAMIFRRIVSHDAWPVPGWKPTKVLDTTSWYLGALVALHMAGGVKLGLRTQRVLPAGARGLLWAGMVVVLYWFATTSPTFIYFYF